MIEKANVLVIGNSGVGKSTLINRVFHFNRAEVGIGNSVTEKMTIYETDEMNFRAIDTKGLEYGYIAQLQTKNSIKKWSKDSVKDSKDEKYIHMIWYCMDATSKRLFDKNLDTIKSVAKMWKDIPIIIVLTKSYSESDVSENVMMVKSAIHNYKDKKHLNIIDIIPVVSEQFQINEDYIIPPSGITQLIETTNDSIPEALQLNKVAVYELGLKIKKNSANTLIATATSGAAVVGAIPIPIADSLILMPLQTGLIYGIAKIYGFKKEDTTMKKITDTIIQSGSITMVAKSVLSGLKAIPGLNIAAAMMNAIVAGIITAILGEITVTIMEKIAKGEVQSTDLDWMRSFTEGEYKKKVGKYVDKIGSNIKDGDDKNIGKIISGIFKDMNKKK